MPILHIWGGLEDLPSIDAECIATLAYLADSEQLHDVSIQISYDASISPNGDFPVLKSNGQAYAGFTSIVKHLQSSSRSSLSYPENADNEAWSTFIHSKGQALLDLYLYASSTNYWSAISPAWTKILPWYANYTIPPARRSAALARTKHLGVRSLDLDSIDEYAAGDDVRIAGQPTTATSFTNTTNPEEIIKKQKSARWLRTQQHSDTFQLFQLTNAFFEPLERLLVESKYLLSGEEPTSADHLLYGYLALMKYSSMPQAWLKDALEKRFKKLDAYTERLHKQFAGSQRRLQISRQTTPTGAQAASALGRGVLGWAIPASRQTITQDPRVERSSFEKAQPTPSTLLSSLTSASVLLPLGALAGIAFGIARYISISDDDSQKRPHEASLRAHEQDFLTPTRLDDLGESGAMLSALGGAFDQQARFDHEKERTGGAPLVEVDVDVENNKGDVARDVVYRK